MMDDMIVESFLIEEAMMVGVVYSQELSSAPRRLVTVCSREVDENAGFGGKARVRGEPQLCKLF